jgi:phosphoribosylanthranilate isomerase
VTRRVSWATYVYQTRRLWTTDRPRTLTRGVDGATIHATDGTTSEEASLTTRVKICGITNAADAALAASLGADLLGFIFADSPRQVSPTTAAGIVAGLPAFQQTVGVFLNASPAHIAATCSAAGLDYAQLHGQESPDVCAQVVAAGIPVIKVITVTEAADLQAADGYTDVSAFLLDRPRGGAMFDWDIARQAASSIPQPIMLAGGLTSDNVVAAIDACAPYAVDVGSGVESAPGVKDPYRLAAFIAAARS